MRVLLIVVLIGLILTVAGVLHFRKGDNEVTISVDKERAEEVVERGKELGNKALDRARDTVEDLDDRTESPPPESR